jgi:hypothetical protein
LFFQNKGRIGKKLQQSTILFEEHYAEAILKKIEYFGKSKIPFAHNRKEENQNMNLST